MKEFNVLDPLQLYSYLDTVLRTTKDLCIDDKVECEDRLYYIPMISFNALDIVLTNFDYHSRKAKYSINIYYREPYEDSVDRLVTSFNLKEDELNDLEIIKQKFIESCKQYLLKREQQSIQNTINTLSKQLIEEDINRLINEECNGLMFSLKDHELFLIKNTENFTKDS